VADLYTRIVSRGLFPLHERLKGHDSVERLRALEASQWLAPEAVEQLRLRRLRDFLVDVGAGVPYYARLFAETRFDPASVRTLEDLREVPFLTKPLIRANTEVLKSRAARRLKRYNTGGSSGEPLIFYIGPGRVSHDVAAKWRATRWWGVDIGDPEIVVWGSPVELGAQDWTRAARDRVLRTKLLSAFEMSAPNLDRFLGAIRSMRPRSLFGYPSALDLIARHAETRGRRMDDLGIEVAFVTAEQLYPDQRARIARTFGCKVANGYGGRDAGFIAHECPEGGMHISAEDIVVEVVDPGSGAPVSPGGAGEIVITHLATADFPFVRYRTGDVGVLDDRRCACRRGLPLLKEIRGRSTDFVVTHDGTVVHALALIYALREQPAVEAFKIVQESRELVRVALVPREGFTETAAEAIRKAFHARLGERVDVRIDRVTEIPPERSGKHRYVVNHLDAH
jgi:phenylacetate-CoA ligase